MSPELKEFINKNIDLINENSKESWESLYSILLAINEAGLVGKFTKVILDSRINDPASILKFVPWGYLAQTEISKYTIPYGVIKLNGSSFLECTKLQSISIPETVAHIYMSAFEGCIRLKNVVLPESLEELHASAFRNCKNLQSINIPKKLKSIWNGTFYNSGLKSIVLHDFLETLGDGAFSSCKFLEYVELHGLPSNYIGENIFTDCPRLEKIICKFNYTPELEQLRKNSAQPIQLICDNGVY